MTRPRIGFLPAFFIALAIAFGIALWLRIRSYGNEDHLIEGRVVAARRANATEAPRIMSPPPLTQTIEPVPRVRKTRQAAAVEVLREQTIAPPATAQPPKAPSVAAASSSAPGKASPASRNVKPIVNPIPSGPSSSTARPQTSGSTSQSQQVQSSSSSSSRGGADTNTPADAQKDRTSDTQPPQLIAIAFNPLLIHDGEETVLSIQASDDLSGIRSISGTVAAPSGAVQGFACQRSDQELDRYTAHITVPKDAAEGMWHVNYLSLIDNASNAATISGALLQTATFRVVSSRSDSQGPTLKSVWIDHQAMKAGEKNTIFVDADDDKSGVGIVSGVLLSPSKLARIGFVCRQGTGAWECEISTPACIDCGDWQLETIQLQDKANNMTTYRTDNPFVARIRVNITSDRCDSTPPTIQALVLDRNVVSNVEDSIINITATASDDLCGVMSMSGQATPNVPGVTARIFFSFTAVDAQTWVARATVPKTAAKGPWRVTWIQVLDQAHNLKTYSQGDPVLATAGFRVQ